MSAIAKGRRIPAASSADLSPGDFQWADDERRPKWLFFGCPRGRDECCVPIAPQKNGAGASWKWDGERDAPTLTPSINCNGKAGCGWHGWLKRGEFVE